MSASSTRKKLVLIFMVLLATIILAYANTLHSSFQFDDVKVVENNQDIRDIHNFTSVSSFRYRHAVSFTYALNYYLGGLHPFGYHLFNIIVHSCASLLIFLISFITINKATSWGRGAAIRIAFATALLFALNPVLSEAITYISGRSSSFASAGYLLSLFAFILGCSKKPGVELPRPLLFLFSMVVFLAAVLSKETALTLPLAIILYDLCFMRSDNWIGWKTRLICFYLFVPLLIVFFVLKSSSSISVFKWWLNHSDIIYALAQIKVLCYAFKLFFLPMGLTLEYNAHYTFDLTEPGFVLSVVFWLFALFWVAKNRAWLSPVPLFAVLWFLITISPTNSFIPREDIFSERNLYLPSFGLAVLSTALFYSLAQAGFRQNLGFAGESQSLSNMKQPQHADNAIFSRTDTGVFFIAGLMTVLVSYSALLITRNNIYQNKIRFWESAYKQNPKKMRVLHNLTLEYMKSENYDKALAILNKMKLINPSYYFTRINLGKVYMHYGKGSLAESEFLAAIKSKPELFEAYFNLGSYYASIGSLHAAKEQYDEALKRNSGEEYPELIFYRAKVCFGLGLFDEAEKNINNYLMKKDLAQARILLAQIYAVTGRESLAEKIYSQDIKGDSVQQSRAYNYLGLLYLKQSRLDDAFAAMKQSVSSNPQSVEAHFNLAKFLLEERGDSENALFHFKKVLELKADTKMAGEVENIISQLQAGNQAK